MAEAGNFAQARKGTTSRVMVDSGLKDIFRPEIVDGNNMMHTTICSIVREENKWESTLNRISGN
jgi:hypothetical protein